MNEYNIIWYKHNCSHCGKVETGFYAEPNTNATFTCGLCGNDLLIVEVDHEKHEMVCEDMNEIKNKYVEIVDDRWLSFISC